MSDLADFGGGVDVDVDTERSADGANDGRAEALEHRRKTYEWGAGRCRGISTSKGCRCGGAALEDSDDDLCFYHGMENDPATVDSPAGLLAGWCGSRPTMWDEIPEPCRTALLEVDPDAADR